MTTPDVAITSNLQPDRVKGILGIWFASFGIFFGFYWSYAYTEIVKQLSSASGRSAWAQIGPLIIVIVFFAFFSLYQQALFAFADNSSRGGRARCIYQALGYAAVMVVMLWLLRWLAEILALGDAIIAMSHAWILTALWSAVGIIVMLHQFGMLPYDRDLDSRYGMPRVDPQ